MGLDDTIFIFLSVYEREREGDRWRERDRGGERKALPWHCFRAAELLVQPMPLTVKRKGELSPGFLNVG